MSTFEFYNKKVRFTLIPLSGFDRLSQLSYIRHTKPDYMLEISGLNVCSVDKYGSKVDFPEPLDCSFFLNYGDLFICALNAIENTPFLEMCCRSFFMEATEKSDICNKIINEAIKKGQEANIYTEKILQTNAEYKRSFSALAFSLLISLVLHEDEKMDGLFSAAIQNLLTTTSFEYGPINPQQLKKNLDENNLFRDITATIRYRKDGIEEYSFSSLFNLIGFEIRQLKNKNDCIKECKSCGRFFIPASRSDEKYCDFIIDGYKTCKQSAFAIRLDKDKALKVYRKIYKTQNARKQRNPQRRDILTKFNTWKVFAKEQLRACQNGKITIEEMIEKISGDEWMI